MNGWYCGYYKATNGKYTLGPIGTNQDNTIIAKCVQNFEKVHLDIKRIDYYLKETISTFILINPSIVKGILWRAYQSLYNRKSVLEIVRRDIGWNNLEVRAKAEIIKRFINVNHLYHVIMQYLEWLPNFQLLRFLN